VSREPDERDGRTRRNARRRCTVSSPFATHESRPGFSALSTQTQQQPGGGSWLGHRVGKLWGEVTGPPRAAASQGATEGGLGWARAYGKAPPGHSGYLRRVRITQRDNERCDQAHTFSPLVAAESAADGSGDGRHANVWASPRFAGSSGMTLSGRGWVAPRRLGVPRRPARRAPPGAASESPERRARRFSDGCSALRRLSSAVAECRRAHTWSTFCVRLGISMSA
jgi:hypothetical protein